MKCTADPAVEMSITVLPYTLKNDIGILYAGCKRKRGELAGV